MKNIYLFACVFLLIASNINAQGTMQPMHSMEMGFKYSLFKNKLNFTLNLSDVFNTRQFEVNSRGVGYYQEFMRKRESRVLTFGGSYSFGNLKTANKPKPKRDNKPENEGGGEGF